MKKQTYCASYEAIYVASLEIQASSQEEADALAMNKDNVNKLGFSLSKGSIEVTSVEVNE